MSEEQEEETKKVIENLQGVIKRDEAHFENKMTLISSGAIALLMAFIAGLGECIHSRCLFTWGISILGFALTMNMALYVIDKSLYRGLQYMLKRKLKEGVYKDPARRNNRLIIVVDVLNAINLAILIAGLIVSFLFVYQNIMQK